MIRFVDDFERVESLMIVQTTDVGRNEHEFPVLHADVVWKRLWKAPRINIVIAIDIMICEPTTR